MGHVRNDEGRTQRVSNYSPQDMNFHADNADIVALACRNQGTAGGADSARPGGLIQHMLSLRSFSACSMPRSMSGCCTLCGGACNISGSESWVVASAQVRVDVARRMRCTTRF